jgi:hypothetical protein
MKRLLRTFSQPKVRESATVFGASALNYSAEPTDFGFASLNNAQGASEAVAELSQYFDEMMCDFEFEGKYRTR